MTTVPGGPEQESGPERPSVTVVVVPRERASVAVDSLRAVYQATERPFDLVYVDFLLSDDELGHVRELLAEHGDEYVRAPERLYPNQARNLGARHADGDHLVFVDNDVFPEPGWLDALVRCARETGAGVVGPLYLEGDREHAVVHCVGGDLEVVDRQEGPPLLHSHHREPGVPPEELPELRRTPIDMIEFHTVLVTRACLEAIGGELDEKLKTVAEHVDLCLMARRAGLEVYLEPQSRIRYGIAEPIRLSDLGFYRFRWSEAATRDTVARFAEKWGVELAWPGPWDMRRWRLKATLRALGLGWSLTLVRRIRQAIGLG